MKTLLDRLEIYDSYVVVRHLVVKLCYLNDFLQRVSIACYAERCISYDRFCPTV